MAKLLAVGVLVFVWYFWDLWAVATMIVAYFSAVAAPAFALQGRRGLAWVAEITSLLTTLAIAVFWFGIPAYTRGPMSTWWMPARIVGVVLFSIIFTGLTTQLVARLTVAAFGDLFGRRPPTDPPLDPPRP